MIRWIGLLLLSACFPDLTGSRKSPEQQATGFWSLRVRATRPESTAGDLGRLDLRGEVRVVGPCEETPANGGDSLPCTGDMRAWYRLAVPRPLNLPPCDEVEVRLPENSDSVVMILSPRSVHSRREIRGKLQDERITGEWAAPPYTGVLQGKFLLRRIERSSGLTSDCDR